MASPPPSIASFIAGQGDPNLEAGSDESQAALLTYLRATYPENGRAAEHTGFGDIPALPSHNYRFTTNDPGPENDQAGPAEPGPSNSGYAPPTPHSPPNPTIAIPPSLAELAAQSTVTINIPNLDIDYSHINFPKGEDTGEMGGKRRKLPHERAGWKEMDQEPRPKRKRGGRRNADNGNGNGSGNLEGNMGDMSFLTAQVDNRDGQVHLEMGGSAQDGVYGASSGEGDPATMPSGANQDLSDPNNLNEPPTKVARAAQNRKAQQVYRRKREDKMKELEAQVAQLGDVKHNLSLAESKLKELALTLETEHIEKLALRQALRNLSQLGTGILDSDSALVTQIGERPRGGVEETTAEVDQAFNLLETQSRELAKANRKRAS